MPSQRQFPNSLVLILLCLQLISLLAIAADEPKVISSPPSMVSEQPGQHELKIDSIAEIEAEINRLEPLAEKEPQAALSLKFYREAKSFLEKIDIYRANEKVYRDSIEANPKAEALLLEQQKKYQPGQSELLKKFNEADLEIEQSRLYAQQKALVSSLKQKRFQLSEKIAEAKLQPDKLTRSRDSLTGQAEAIRLKLQEEKVSSDNKELRQASLLASQLELKAIQVQLAMVEAQRLSMPSYLSLLETQVNILKDEIRHEQKLEQEMLQLLEQRRRVTEEKIREEAARLSNRIIANYPSLKALLDNNLDLNVEQHDLNEMYTQANHRLARVVKRKEQLDLNFQRLKQQLAIEAPDSLMGEFLYQQRDDLASILIAKRDHDAQKEDALTLGRARLSQFKVDDQLQNLGGNDEYLNKILAELKPNAQWQALSSRQQQSVQRELKQLLDNKVSLLKRLREQYDNYIKLLNDIDLVERQFWEKSGQYHDLLNENLWLLPSNKPIHWVWFKEVYRQFRWFFSWETWSEAAKLSFLAASKNWFLALSILVIVGAIVWFKKSLKEHLAVISNSVDKVTKDSYWLTFQTLLITIILALPWTLLIYLDGYLLHQEHPGSFSYMIGSVLMSLAKYVFMLELIRLILIEKGLAEVHFQWSTGLRQVIRNSLPWFTPAFAISWFFIATTYYYYGQESINLTEFSRFSFLIFLILNLALIYKIHKVWDSPVCTVKYKRSGSFVYYLLVAILLGLLVVTMIGYYLSAIRLLILLFGAFYLLFFLFIAYFMALRWLSLARKRLAYKRALKRREVEQKIRTELKALEHDENEVNDMVKERLASDKALGIMDIEQIDIQVRRMLKWLMVFAVFVGLGWHFREISPILNVLDDMVLWQYQEVGGKIAHTSVWDLLVSLMVLITTMVAAKNLPGLLEIALLNPLRLKSGNRYAISRIVQYVIFVIGFIIFLAWLGLAWGDIQWLVTAMGVGLGFGLKEIFSNFFSGLILLFERPIRIGDVVTIGDVTGKVSKIRIRATTVIDWDRKELIIPNQSLILEKLVNWTLSNQTTRVSFMLGVAYGSDTEKVQQLILDTISQNPLVLEDPAPQVLFLNFGDSSLDFKILVFVGDTDYRMKVTHELHVALEKVMRENNIEIPFPQRDLHIHQSIK